MLHKIGFVLVLLTTGSAFLNLLSLVFNLHTVYDFASISLMLSVLALLIVGRLEAGKTSFVPKPGQRVLHKANGKRMVVLRVWETDAECAYWEEKFGRFTKTNFPHLALERA